VCDTATFRSLATLGMTTDGKCRSRSEFSGWTPRAGLAQKLAPNFSFKHGRQQSTKSSYRPVGLRGAANDRPAIKKRSRLWHHYYPGGGFRAFPKANSRVYSSPNRSAWFSNSPRQPEANVRLCRGTEALSSRWRAEPGQLQWMSAITGTMIPTARRCRESVCPETS